MGILSSKPANKLDYKTIVYRFDSVSDDIQDKILRILQINIHRSIKNNPYNLLFHITDSNLYNFQITFDSETNGKTMYIFQVGVNILHQIVVYELAGLHFTASFIKDAQTSGYLLNFNIVQYAGDVSGAKMEIITQDIDDIISELMKIEKLELPTNESKKDI